MSVKSGFFNSLNGDRKYSSKDISNIFDGVITDGVFATVGSALAVVANSGMKINISSGRAWFNHTWTDNSDVYSITISNSELLLNRIDTVVLEVNSTDEIRENTFKVISGTAASNPSAPELTQSNNVHQYPLANIYVGAGVSEIAQENITNRIGTSYCPFVTGILQTISSDMLLAQWNSEFEIWFSNLRNELDSNQAAHLQSEINQLFELTSSNPEIRKMRLGGI